jgi:hypothetical protein
MPKGGETPVEGPADELLGCGREERTRGGFPSDAEYCK